MTLTVSGKLRKLAIPSDRRVHEREVQDALGEGGIVQLKRRKRRLLVLSLVVGVFSALTLSGGAISASSQAGGVDDITHALGGAALDG